VDEGGTISAVYINTDGQLGTQPPPSSRRFKEDVKLMDKTSEAILALKPVTFHFKNDEANIPQFGLIAEEVAQVNPDLVSRDRDGKPYTVRYEAVNAMLLNEFLKEHRKNEEQGATIAEQQKEIQALAATVKEQTSQIQKVSVQVELSKPAPQTVLSNH
jgi:Chaperone of endosialidase